MTASPFEWAGDELLTREIEALSEKLRPDGWRVILHYDEDLYIELSNDLTLATRRVFLDDIDPVSSLRKSFMNWEEARILHDAPIESPRRGLIGKLRRLGSWPTTPDTTRTVVAVGHILAEEGLLTDDECEWLIDSIRPDLDTS